MPVNMFSEILLWPIRLEGRREPYRKGDPLVNREKTSDRWAESLTSGKSNWCVAGSGK